MPRVAIVVALEREVGQLLRRWRSSEREYGGRRFRFYENDNAVLTAGGIGGEPARRAAEAILALYAPGIIYSAGFAGALDSRLKIGDVIVPRRVVNAGDGSSVDTGQGEGVLVTFSSVASAEQKRKLADSYGADAVDMEAAAVARAAAARGVQFAAVKAISDENDFALPAMERFINANGEFSVSRFVLFAGVRPWMWRTVLRLASNSNRASRALCEWIKQMDMNHSGVHQLSVNRSLRSSDQP
jgi:adenosylhomocysteine nucleosidase